MYEYTKQKYNIKIVEWIDYRVFHEIFFHKISLCFQRKRLQDFAPSRKCSCGHLIAKCACNMSVFAIKIQNCSVYLIRRDFRKRILNKRIIEWQILASNTNFSESFHFDIALKLQNFSLLQNLFFTKKFNFCKTFHFDLREKACEIYRLEHFITKTFLGFSSKTLGYYIVEQQTSLTFYQKGMRQFFFANYNFFSFLIFHLSSDRYYQ